MRVVVAIDGDLLVPQNQTTGIPGQRDEINRLTGRLGELLGSEHELVFTHGNASQVGFVLLRAEMASHLVHPLPLDVCGADTQGATGYLLQQAFRNWLHHHAMEREVATIITQAEVDLTDLTSDHPTRGVGPYYDREKAFSYTATRDWHFVTVPGRGYRRAVPALKPKRVVETRMVESLLESGAIVICAGGGGVPVSRDPEGSLNGVEAVIDKAYTSALLAAEINADALIFIAVWERVARALQMSLGSQPLHLSVSEVEKLVDCASQIDEDTANKLKACRHFLTLGGKKAVITSPAWLSDQPDLCGGIHITKNVLTMIKGEV